MEAEIVTKFDADEQQNPRSRESCAVELVAGCSRWPCLDENRRQIRSCGVRTPEIRQVKRNCDPGAILIFADAEIAQIHAG